MQVSGSSLLIDIAAEVHAQRQLLTETTVRPVAKTETAGSRLRLRLIRAELLSNALLGDSIGRTEVNIAAKFKIYKAERVQRMAVVTFLHTSTHLDECV